LYFNGEWHWLPDNENNELLIKQELSRYGRTATRRYPEDGSNPLDCLRDVTGPDKRIILEAYGITDQRLIKGILPHVTTMKPRELENLSIVYE